MASNVTHDVWRSRMLPMLERRWRALDAERALHQALEADAAGDQETAAKLLERAAELEAA